MIKLEDIYKNKICPYRIGYVCDGEKCVKFISCILDEIDSLHIVGVDSAQIYALDRDIIKKVFPNAHDNC